MSKKRHAKLIKKMFVDSFWYIAKGGFYIKDAHLPQTNHAVPTDFIGICVASNIDPKTDTYIISQLKTLGLNHVRLDFSYSDLNHFNERFLQKLIAENLAVTLHLIAPYEAAKAMDEQEEQTRWRDFLTTVLDRYGASIKQVEIGNTVNRKRWAGYQFDHLYIAWETAYTEVKSRGIQLLGPNVQDFEPIYNIGILNQLQSKKQLPDIHTDNLFVERVSEPERFDHRILKFQWAKKLQYNLIKKARILQKIGVNFGVDKTTSSAAFWAIYRIKRILANGEQKQADYLTRYFTLLATSGALQQANWGALICNREGLIDDGLTGEQYPDLERIAHYQSADGQLAQYKRYPSFDAMQTTVKYLSGSHYQQAITSADGLEIHHFTQGQTQFHVAWTINGKIAHLDKIYSKKTLSSAKIYHRDGKELRLNTGFICEIPIYLCWEADADITLLTNPKLTKNLIIHAHSEGLSYFDYTVNGWSGLVLAKDAHEANLLKAALNPEQLHAPQKASSLRHARNVIWAATDPRNEAAQITIKQPVKMYPHKALFDRFKPSKAKRSWNGAMELARRGIGTAHPIAYFEKIGDTTLKQNFYICERVAADCTIGELFSAFARGESSYKGLSPEEVYRQFAQFSHNMHKRGIYFRDYSGGNILVNIQTDNVLQFSLIDTARLRSFNQSIPLTLRIADLTRACHKLHSKGRKRFMQMYLALSGRQLNIQIKLKFWLYDGKVKLKRTIGRKGMKKLLKRIKSFRQK